MSSRRSSVTKKAYKDFVMALMVPVSSLQLRPSDPTFSQKSMENMRSVRGEKTEMALKIEAQPMKNSCEVIYLRVSNK